MIIWDAFRLEKVRILQGHNHEVTAFSFLSKGSVGTNKITDKKNINNSISNPSDYWIVSGSSDKTIRIWDPDTGQQVCSFYLTSYLIRSFPFLYSFFFLLSSFFFLLLFV